jgi:MFS family permease
MVVKEPPATSGANEPRLSLREVGRDLFATRTARCAYLGSAFSYFVTGSMLAWLPSYLNRYHGMDPAKAGLYAGIAVLIAGVGMVGGGALVDRLSRNDRRNRMRIPALYALGCALLLAAAFFLPPGPLQFVLIATGLMVGAGFAGPSGAVVADMTHASIHATVFATATLINNLLGLAPGPFLIGWIADHTSLQTAMKFVPLVGMLSAALYFIGAKTYEEDRRRVHGEPSRVAGRG